ncbi:fumarylacetoacetate hydrolase family protein [Thalassotalea atypica]|uniref:fumarylacetoacetate hydrolase family protein n=1 Tax=Thalassotalea atypica TaxID=2054316 RepID=UPI002572EA3F|nr:fumarylacetoacetate hydrolase family protein [Thalassotalea atypica]
MYQHQTVSLNNIDLPVGKVVCVGQNYHDHIQEMGSIVNDEPVLFMKPSTALHDLLKPFSVPENQGDCHNEAEIAVLIHKPLKNAAANDVMDAVWGYGIGLDLTLREVQQSLKKLGRPWEIAKAFDGSAPVSPFIEKSQFSDPQNISFSLLVNDDTRQQGNSKLMVHSITKLLSTISQHFTLLPGDIVLTGTPAGVGPLIVGDELELSITNHKFNTKVIKAAD